MEGQVRGGTLAIRTAGDQSEVEISGTRRDIIFNWIALTHQVCSAIGVPPTILAMTMPAGVEDYLKNSLNYAIRTMGKEGQP